MQTNFYKTRILVVEDEHFMRSLIIQALQSSGFTTILEAENGKKALQLLERGSVDIIVTDIEMKGVDGFDLVRAVRMGKTHQARNTPVIFLTGLSDVSTLSSAAQLDAQGFLIKPMSAKQLQEKIADALRKDVRIHPVNTYEAMALVSTAHDNVRKPIPQPADATQSESDESTPVGSPLHAIRMDVLMLTEGMTLRQDVHAKGMLLLKAGTCLNASHITVLQDMRSLLDNRQIEVDPAKAEG
ncbi:MAG: response regulator [Sedimenticolaceae bacterium]